MQFYLIDWRHKHTHTYTQKETDPSGLYWRPPAQGKASWRSEPILGPLRLVRSLTIWCGKTRTRHTMPLQAQAGDPRGTGSQAHRPQEKTLCWWDPRKVTTDFIRPPDVRRPEANSQLALSLVWPTRASLIPLPHWAERERSRPIFGAKPERNACAHIWG